jgi:1-acyl-sn-glycerol-3-phosphate acyltransferase
MMSEMTTSYRIGWTLFRLLFSSYFHWRVFHPERVPPEGPVILASNHASYLDPPLVGSGLGRPINYLARDSLFRFPVFGSILRSWNAVPVDRDGTSPRGLKNIIDRLKAGGGVVLFPEGTRTHDGGLVSAKSGVGLVVIKSQAPVVPVRVFGTFEAYGRRMRIPLPRPVTVKYGQPLDFVKERSEAATCSKERLKQIYQEVAERIMAEIARLEPCRDVESFADRRGWTGTG